MQPQLPKPTRRGRKKRSRGMPNLLTRADYIKTTHPTLAWATSVGQKLWIEVLKMMTSGLITKASLLETFLADLTDAGEEETERIFPQSVNPITSRLSTLVHALAAHGPTCPQFAFREQFKLLSLLARTPYHLQQRVRHGEGCTCYPYAYVCITVAAKVAVMLTTRAMEEVQVEEVSYEERVTWYEVDPDCMFMMPPSPFTWYSNVPVWLEPPSPMVYCDSAPSSPNELTPEQVTPPMEAPGDLELSYRIELPAAAVGESDAPYALSLGFSDGQGDQDISRSTASDEGLSAADEEFEMDNLNYYLGH